MATYAGALGHLLREEISRRDQWAPLLYYIRTDAWKLRQDSGFFSGLGFPSVHQSSISNSPTRIRQTLRSSLSTFCEQLISVWNIPIDFSHVTSRNHVWKRLQKGKRKFSTSFSIKHNLDSLAVRRIVGFRDWAGAGQKHAILVLPSSCRVNNSALRLRLIREHCLLVDQTNTTKASDESSFLPAMYTLKEFASSSLSLAGDNYIYSIVPSSRTEFAAISSDDSLRIFDASKLSHASLVANNAHDGVTSLGTYDASKQLVITGGRDGKMKLWDLRNGKNTAVVAVETCKLLCFLSYSKHFYCLWLMPSIGGGVSEYFLPPRWLCEQSTDQYFAISQSVPRAINSQLL
jgi:WD40 repeat protein